MSNKQPKRIGRKSALAIASTLALWTLAWPSARPAVAQAKTSPSDDVTASEEKASQVITIEPGKAKKLTFDQKIKKANILLPDVADVVPLGPNELLITAKKSGATQLIIWDETDHTQIIEVDVSTPVARLQKQLVSLFPGSKINVEDANGTITLTGQVHDLATARQAELIATPYSSGGKLVDLMEIAGGQQVMLKVKFAEVSKQAEAQLGFNFGGTDGMSVFGGNFGGNSLGFTPGIAAAPRRSPGHAESAGRTDRHAERHGREHTWNWLVRQLRSSISSTPSKRTACCALWPNPIW